MVDDHLLMLPLTLLATVNGDSIAVVISCWITVMVDFFVVFF